MNATDRPKKSTNVRAYTVTFFAARAGLRALSPHAPTLASLWAERLFLTARRHERPSWEQEALASARPGRLAHAGGFIPTWTWTPERTTAGAIAPPTVVLVHGWEGRGSQLAGFVPELLGRGFRVVAFDAPGHGDSTLPHASVVEHARALCTVAREVGPLHAVVGHSVGGAASLLATRFGLEADRLALIAPPTTPAHYASAFSRALGLGKPVERAMIARLEARYELRFEELNARLDAERLHRPLLVVHDRDDRVVAVENGRQIANDAPQGELVEVTGLGHRAILRSPDVIATVGRFLGDGATADERPRRRSAVAGFAETIDGELFMRDLRW